jgi:hypothetical protein
MQSSVGIRLRNLKKYNAIFCIDKGVHFDYNATMSAKTRQKRKDVLVTITMPRPLVERLAAAATAKGISRSAIARWALLKYFESEKVAV